MRRYVRQRLGTGRLERGQDLFHIVVDPGGTLTSSGDKLTPAGGSLLDTAAQKLQSCLNERERRREGCDRESRAALAGRLWYSSSSRLTSETLIALQQEVENSSPERVSFSSSSLETPDQALRNLQQGLGKGRGLERALHAAVVAALFQSGGEYHYMAVLSLWLDSLLSASTCTHTVGVFESLAPVLLPQYRGWQKGWGQSLSGVDLLVSGVNYMDSSGLISLLGDMFPSLLTETTPSWGLPPPHWRH